MKRLVAVFLLLSVAEGKHFWRQWGPPPGHSHFHPGQTFQPPGQVCPPGLVQSCSPPTQSQYPPVQPPPFSPPGFGPDNQPGFGPGNQPGFRPGNQPSPNWNQQTEFQQNGNLNSPVVDKAEWVCRNPATGDMMIIVGINGTPSQNGQNPGDPNAGNLNNGEDNHNAYTTPQSITNEPSLPHGGEGLIDIRLGGDQESRRKK